jgi:uncharacterized protein YndB with AHSA1/START domain
MKSKLFIPILLLGAWTNAAAQQRTHHAVADNGTVTVMRSATLQVYVASDAATVFSDLSDQTKLPTWLSDQAILEPQFGGKYHLRWKSQESVDGVVTEFTPGNTLALTWRHPSDASETQVRFKVSPQGGRTMVEEELQGYASNDALDKAVNFWAFYLKNLKSVIETQTDLRPVATRAPTRRRTQ